MRARGSRSGWISLIAVSALILSLVGSTSAATRPHADGPAGPTSTATPIKHLVVIVGENHSFDNIFATYRPPKGQHVRNLLSQEIVTRDGGLGPSAQKALQRTARGTGVYEIEPPLADAYAHLPQPNTTTIRPSCNGGQPMHTPDIRFPKDLPNAPFQITKYVPYDDMHPGELPCPVSGAFVGDPIHRFFQMWQQIDGGRNDLFTWVAETAGADSGAIPPAPTYQGALQMGYYNMATGDTPVMRALARQFSMSDNFHQAVMGGTGVNHVVLGSGDVPYYSDGRGTPTRPPTYEIENPNPKPGTDNNFMQDGTSGGSYVNCSDPEAPGVRPIQEYLLEDGRLPFRKGNCASGHYYLVNNQSPGYTPSGGRRGGLFVIPPQTFPNIADALSAQGVSWGYFGQGWNNGRPRRAYCEICNPFLYFTSVMTTPLRENLHGFTDFMRDVQQGTLPAVSIVKPGNATDGHPGSSTMAAFEGFTKNVVDAIMAKPELFRDTAILVTFDENGGYYDSGYVQPIHFFGDGPRIPMIAVSPYTRAGHVSHTYGDHGSILKFIEKNWGLEPLSDRSLDNLPNPVATEDDPYVPANAPAIGDLTGLFDFEHPRTDLRPLP